MVIKDLVELGKNLNIPDKVIHNAIESMSSHFSQWESMIEKSFLNDALKEQFDALIKKRLQIIKG